MKRQIQESGIRKWYGDDWIAMQDQLYDALEKGVLTGIGNVILSGCEITGNSIGAGYVYIDGRICPFAGAAVASFSVYLIKEESTTKQRLHLNGLQKPVETQHIAITNATATAQSIQIEASNNPRLLQPRIDASGNLVGIPKSSSNNEANDNLLATSAAVAANKVLIDTKADESHIHNWASIAEKSSAFTPDAHSHDDRYYTESELDAFFEGTLLGKKQVKWKNILDKPSNVQFRTLISNVVEEIIDLPIGGGLANRPQRTTPTPSGWYTYTLSLEYHNGGWITLHSERGRSQNPPRASLGSIPAPG